VRHSSFAMLLIIAACGASDDEPGKVPHLDAGQTGDVRQDSGARSEADASRPELDAVSDSGTHDGGRGDVGAPEPAESDAGKGEQDAGAFDGGASDNGASDAGASDNGASDAGASDAGRSATARAIVADGGRLVDVRTAEEFAQGHIEGALNFPVETIGNHLKELEPKDGWLVVYCRSGSRSAKAVTTLKNGGFTKVFDLGAMTNW
jgi:phage shock protein E